jgi:hypothetical protein
VVSPVADLSPRPDVGDSTLENAMNDDQVRDELAKLLKSGLKTEADDRPVTSEARNAIVGHLQSIADNDRRAKLVVAGFLDHPYATSEDGVLQGCETCMYFELHRRYCNLPELEIPVKPEWSCRMWRI